MSRFVGARSRITVLMLFVMTAVFGRTGYSELQAARERANVRSCYENCKTLIGAMEMYNLDH